MALRLGTQLADELPPSLMSDTDDYTPPRRQDPLPGGLLYTSI
jgi:hypothetical protein